MNEKKYVIYIGAMVMPDKNAGAQRVTALAKSIRDIGYQPVIIGLDYEVTRNAAIISTRKQYCGIDCYAIHYPSGPLEWLRRMTGIREFINIFRHYGPDSIHSIIAIDYEVIALLRLLIFCRKNRIYLIADNMEWYEKSKLSFPQNIVKDLDTYLRMKVIYPHMKNMICISRYLYLHYRRIDPGKTLVLLPVTVDKADPKWHDLPEYVPNKIFTIIYAGDPGDYCIKERLDWLIYAVCRANIAGNSCRLVIIGVDRLRFEKQYPGLQDLEGYGNVIFKGKLPHRECLYEINRADLFTIIREDRLVTRAGFPTKLSEGLACGTPVLTTPSSNISEFVTENETGFITGGFTYGDIEQAVCRAVQTEREQLIRLHKNSREYNRLNYSNYNNRLKNFFGQLNY